MRGLVVGLLTVIAIFALLIAALCCHITVATNDYRPILTAAVGFWVLGSVCFGVVYWLERKSPILILCLWAIPSAIVWMEMLRRGPIVFLGPLR
ncbi:hypothetical protein AYO44_12640 [Planctomycetaceae bacterium SCGC AG-212-F19]|nr:hypothetical protein AYO44_12640 [Planctomycetaceae bacterium SCGC AG-212-F19]